MEATSVWKKCSRCKSPIGFGSTYYVCSVSTCNGQRTGYVFCRHLCFEAHLPGARHRDAGAIEQKAPASGAADRPPERKIVPAKSAVGGGSSVSSATLPKEVLIIASRLKEYIDQKCGFNTSGQVLESLSDLVRSACDRAIENARADGRKTVMERDFKK